MFLLSFNIYGQSTDEDAQMPLTPNLVTILTPKTTGGLKSASAGWSLLGPSSMPDQSLG